MKRAREAKDSGRVLDIVDAAAVAGCRDVGQASTNSWSAGMRGRAHIRVELRKTAVEHGASHVRFSDYHDGEIQSEAARFYDCTSPRVADGPKAAIVDANPEAPGDASRPTPHVALAVQFDLLPVGSLTTDAGAGTGASRDFDLDKAYGVSAGLDYVVNSSLAIGANPGLIFGLQGNGAMSSATEVDLRVRARFGGVVPDDAAVHGYATVGGSWIYFPANVTSSGVMFGFGLALSYRLGDSGFITFEAGYQISAQTVANRPGDLEGDLRLFHLGVGLGTYL